MSSSSPKSQSHTPFTIPTLLSSLSQHLQEQTELLPTLHAQLGLPPSALSDELSSLHQRLTTCVEDQIELRRQEVDEWMKRCDVVERECSKYTKTLGGNTKMLRISLGELKKQKALPVRHEMLNQYLEKLDNLYRAKLEQLSNLSNRLVTLSKTLGPNFFAVGVIEPSLSYIDNTDDEKILHDVTPERFSKLEKECARGRSEITRRLQQLAATFINMDWLYQELGIMPPSEDSDPFAPSSSNIRVPQSTRTSIDDDPFATSTSTPTPCPRGKRSAPSLLANSEPMPDYRRIYADFIVRVDDMEAEGKDIDKCAFAALDGVEPSVGLMTWAEESKAELEDIKTRRETHIQSMYDQLEALWKRLGVEDEDIDGFVENNRGSTEENVKAYEQELERMLELKSQSMSVFIANARTEIEALWDELMFGELERSEFGPFTDDEYTEELLLTHEEEIRRLKEERKSKAPILARLQKYFEICGGEKELEAAAQDQSRLLGRGPRDPGRLLREEKMRKRVKREKPKLEQELMASIPTWEEAEGRPFLVNGERVLEVLESMGASAKPAAKTRAGSIPPASRPVAPAAPGTATKRKRGTLSRGTSAEPQQAAPPSTNKRQRVMSTNGKSRGISTSSSEQEERTLRALPHRAPFGSRSGALNASTGTGMGMNVPSTAQKRTLRTPNVNGSTIPRPASAAARNRPTPGTQKKAGAGIGLGHASTVTTGQKGRAVTTDSTFRSFGFSQSSTQSGRATVNCPGQVKKLPLMRNNRRESFRPRASVIEPRFVGYGAASGGTTDDDY